MLGKEVHQPQDTWLGVAQHEHGEKEPPEYVHDLEKILSGVHEMTCRHLCAAQQRQKRTHDLRAQQHSYAVEDLVYLTPNFHTLRQRSSALRSAPCSKYTQRTARSFSGASQKLHAATLRWRYTPDLFISDYASISRQAAT